MFFHTSLLPARHGFFTRKGGVSGGAYASLNCSYSGDDPANVRANRARVAAAMDVAPDKLLGLKQVHGREVAVVQTPWAEGSGPPADALVCTVPGLALSIITADCAPVLFYGRAPAGGIAGAAHAGWRGAVGGVLEATVAAMRGLGADHIEASIGPCIQQGSYEVGPDMRDAVLAAGRGAARFFSAGRPGHWWFDLPGYCEMRLAALGVKAQSLGLDTCAAEQDFFSHRRRSLRGETQLGHQISVICT